MQTPAAQPRESLLNVTQARCWVDVVTRPSCFWPRRWFWNAFGEGSPHLGQEAECPASFDLGGRGVLPPTSQSQTCHSDTLGHQALCTCSHGSFTNSSQALKSCSHYYSCFGEGNGVSQRRNNWDNVVQLVGGKTRVQTEVRLIREAWPVTLGDEGCLL